MNNRTITLAGNPNVGKSTIFNSLTGLSQHTGNWPGKTIGNAIGTYIFHEQEYTIYDLPGTYSLNSNSQEETIARDFICSNETAVTVVVCDATCLERNLNLVIQIMELTSNVIVCVNLLDEAKKKKISIDLKKLSTILQVPVIGTTARSNIGLEELKLAIKQTIEKPKKDYLKITYPDQIETSIQQLLPYLINYNLNLNPRWLALRLLDDDNQIIESLKLSPASNLTKEITKQRQFLSQSGIQLSGLKDKIISAIVQKSERISQETITLHNKNYHHRDLQIDKIVTSRIIGIPLMLLLLLIIFWLTIIGSNYPSDLIYKFLFSLEDDLLSLLSFLPNTVTSILVFGIYRVVSWVVSVMLPPMAIFFPVFTILEDLGYLPRIAFNLDHCFQKCKTCGKQALTMCMGFGCNAVGVTGCRIIDSPRERLIAIITNSFVPCNGRFPMLIALITMFFIGFEPTITNTILTALFLVILILFSIFMTFTVSKILSKTILKGLPSSFTLELPPYRKPQFGKVIIRSIFDRTLFVLGRAISVAAPAGLIIYALANININNQSILTICANFLDPFATLIGLDGIILIAFILGFPANEIVIPIIIMAYMSTGTITNYENLNTLKTLLIDNGWTWVTALCTIAFSLIHFPCSTTCLTIKKETNSWKWTIISFLIPTIIGITLCFLINTLAHIFCLI